MFLRCLPEAESILLSCDRFPPNEKPKTQTLTNKKHGFSFGKTLTRKSSKEKVSGSCLDLEAMCLEKNRQNNHLLRKNYIQKQLFFATHWPNKKQKCLGSAKPAFFMPVRSPLLPPSRTFAFAFASTMVSRFFSKTFVSSSVVSSWVCNSACRFMWFHVVMLHQAESPLL